MSFRKTSKDGSTGVPSGSGAQASIYHNQLMISTGLDDLDKCLGGGLPIGSVCLIEEDVNTQHFLTLERYFLAEGLACANPVFLAASDVLPADILRGLPLRISEEEYLRNIQEDEKAAAKQRESDGGGGLKIAWRYQDSLERQRDRQLNRGGFAHSFDLSKEIPLNHFDPKQIEMLNIQTINQSEKGSVYQTLASAISRMLAAHSCWHPSDGSSAKAILRIVIHSAHSPLWSLQNSRDDDFIKFMHSLRSMLRAASAVCILSCPMHLQSVSLCRRVEHLADAVLSLQSFQDEASRPDAFREYTGLFNVIKLPHLGSLARFVPETLSYGFTRKKKKLYIEKLHLPPETSRSSSSSTLQDMLCTKPTQHNPLDF